MNQSPVAGRIILHLSATPVSFLVHGTLALKRLLTEAARHNSGKDFPCRLRSATGQKSTRASGAARRKRASRSPLTRGFSVRPRCAGTVFRTPCVFVVGENRKSTTFQTKHPEAERLVLIVRQRTDDVHSLLYAACGASFSQLCYACSTTHPMDSTATGQVAVSR